MGIISEFYEERIDGLLEKISELKEENERLSKSNSNLTELLGRYMMAHGSEKLNSNDLYEANCVLRDLEGGEVNNCEYIPHLDCQTC